MITKTILDIVTTNGRKIDDLTPVCFLEWMPGDQVAIELPDGTKIITDAARISGGTDDPEETISELARQMGLGYDALVKAAREGRVLARKSGATWLTTRCAVGYAIEHGKLRRGELCCCSKGMQESVFNEDGLLEWCDYCGFLICDHHLRKFGRPHPAG